jgi:hypothetical protein
VPAIKSAATAAAVKDFFVVTTPVSDFFIEVTDVRIAHLID